MQIENVDNGPSQEVLLDDAAISIDKDIIGGNQTELLRDVIKMRLDEVVLENMRVAQQAISNEEEIRQKEHLNNIEANMKHLCVGKLNQSCFVQKMNQSSRLELTVIGLKSSRNINISPLKKDAERSEDTILEVSGREFSDDDEDVLEDEMPRLNAQDKKGEQQHKIDRMNKRQNRVRMIFYPEDEFKANWDLLLTLLLVITCIHTPYRIAFEEEASTGQNIFNNTIDIFFLVDIIFNFNTAFTDDDFQVIDNRKIIAIAYLKSWFFIDTIAIIPFEAFLGGSGMNEVVRLARIGRLYKLIKLTKLLRVFKIVKDRSKFLKYVQDMLQLGYGFERLIFFVLVFLIMCHIVSCLWVFQASFSKNYVDTWLEDSHEEMTQNQMYLTSFYFTVTTITTVGYGDISGSNTIEMIFCISIMIIGVIAFSFATGSLASILQNYDVQNAKFQEKVLILNRIYKNYFLPLDLYQRLKQSMRYNYAQDIDDLNAFVDDLPQGLKVEVSLFIHEQTYKKIKFLMGRSDSFIAWICPLMRPMLNLENQYIFFEGDDVSQIYFFMSGEAGYVLPKHNNIKYIEFQQGNHFGVTDIVGSVLSSKDQDLEKWMNYKESLRRQFTSMSQTRCELLTLSVDELARMQHEFQEPYENLFESAYSRLNRCLKIKLKAIRFLNEEMTQKISESINSKKTLIERMTMLSKLTKHSKAKSTFNPIQMNQVDDESSMFHSSRDNSLEIVDLECSDQEEEQFRLKVVEQKKRQRKQSIFDQKVQLKRAQTKNDRKIKELEEKKAQEEENTALVKLRKKTAKDDKEVIDESKNMMALLQEKMSQKMAKDKIESKLKNFFLTNVKASNSLRTQMAGADPIQSQILVQLQQLVQNQQAQEKQNKEISEQLAKLAQEIEQMKK